MFSSSPELPDGKSPAPASNHTYIHPSLSRLEYARRGEDKPEEEEEGSAGRRSAVLPALAPGMVASESVEVQDRTMPAAA
jgi:hypothetical protein